MTRSACNRYRWLCSTGRQPFGSLSSDSQGTLTQGLRTLKTPHVGGGGSRAPAWYCKPSTYSRQSRQRARPSAVAFDGWEQVRLRAVQTYRRKRAWQKCSCGPRRLQQGIVLHLLKQGPNLLRPCCRTLDARTDCVAVSSVAEGSTRSTCAGLSCDAPAQLCILR